MNEDEKVLMSHSSFRDYTYMYFKNVCQWERKYFAMPKGNFFPVAITQPFPSKKKSFIFPGKKYAYDRYISHRFIFFFLRSYFNNKGLRVARISFTFYFVLIYMRQFL